MADRTSGVIQTPRRTLEAKTPQERDVQATTTMLWAEYRTALAFLDDVCLARADWYRDSLRRSDSPGADPIDDGVRAPGWSALQAAEQLAVDRFLRARGALDALPPGAFDD